MEKEINPKLKSGDRVIVIYMKDKYSRVPVGVGGVVVSVGEDPFEKDEQIIQVDWDNGSKLALLSSEDLWILEKDIKKQKIKEQYSPNINELFALKDIFKYSDEKVFFEFLKKIRESGLVNMFESSQFVASGPEYLERFIKFDEIKNGKEYDEDMVEELLDLSQKSKDEVIRIAIRIIENQGKEVTLENVQRTVRNLEPKILRYYILMF